MSIDWAIIYDAAECDCEKCKAYYEWFDSDDADPEHPPERCEKGAIAIIEFEKEGDL